MGSSYPTLAANFTASGNPYLEVASNPTLQTGDIDITVAGWAYVTTLLGTQVLWIKGTATNGGQANAEWGLQMNVAGALTWHCIGTTDASIGLSGGSLVPGAWYYVACWRDTGAGQIRATLNDGAVASAAQPTGTQLTNVSVRLGSDQSARQFIGRLDSVGYWKRVLTAAERTALYNGGVGLAYRDLSGAMKANLAAWWNLDGSGMDSSGNLNHLANNNGVTYTAGKR